MNIDNATAWLIAMNIIKQSDGYKENGEYTEFDKRLIYNDIDTYINTLRIYLEATTQDIIGG